MRGPMAILILLGLGAFFFFGRRNGGGASGNLTREGFLPRVAPVAAARAELRATGPQLTSDRFGQTFQRAPDRAPLRFAPALIDIDIGPQRGFVGSLSAEGFGRREGLRTTLRQTGLAGRISELTPGQLAARARLELEFLDDK